MIYIHYNAYTHDSYTLQCIYTTMHIHYNTYTLQYIYTITDTREHDNIDNKLLVAVPT